MYNVLYVCKELPFFIIHLVRELSKYLVQSWRLFQIDRYGYSIFPEYNSKSIPKPLVLERGIPAKVERFEVYDRPNKFVDEQESFTEHEIMSSVIGTYTAYGDPTPIFKGEVVTVESTFPRLYKPLDQCISEENELANAYLPEVVQNEPVDNPFENMEFQQVSYDDGHGHYDVVHDRPEVMFPSPTKDDTPVFTGDADSE